MTSLPAPLPDHPESPLLAEHRADGAVLTQFAGWTMPLRYGSELAEHRAVRTRAGVFDLSHMAQLEVTGPDAGAALDGALVSVVSALAPGRARYTILADTDGGTLDDLVVYRLAEAEFLVIANAANRAVVVDALTDRSAALRASVVDRTAHRALVAIQGPASAAVLDPLTTADLAGLRYYGIVAAEVAGVPALVARTGYTGEDGFELSVPASSAGAVWRATLAAGHDLGAVPCGLACRDTLRLEAAMPLYGNELSRGTTPVEAGLARLVDLHHEFVGRAALAARMSRPSDRVLVGLVGEGRRAARAGSAVLHDGARVGEVTSGALSPTLGVPVALAFVERDRSEPGTELGVDVRGTLHAMRVTPLPFYRRPR